MQNLYLSLHIIKNNLISRPLYKDDFILDWPKKPTNHSLPSLLAGSFTALLHTLQTIDHCIFLTQMHISETVIKFMHKNVRTSTKLPTFGAIICDSLLITQAGSLPTT